MHLVVNGGIVYFRRLLKEKENGEVAEMLDKSCHIH